MEYEVKIDNFEGPLDLLLHLIKESKVDIWEISIADIAEEYLAYIQRMEKLNLDIASEYLVMASELIEMKSRMLLPRPEKEVGIEEEEDPKERLIRRLVEYQKYKEVTKNFKELESLRQEFYTKAPDNLKEYVEEGVVPSSDVTLEDLMVAFQKFLNRKVLEKPLQTTVTKKEITVEERRKSIRDILSRKKRVDFFELFEVVTREYIVVTFLAILEMAKKQELLIKQESDFSEIMIEVVA
ncbi:MAG TPA: segregation/condensation protein A [Candidatus Scybalousia intestinigallinarum]|nr:segregation/condensation protein A [Candidatus Scybalousia intestinigallinarum]